MEIGKKYVVVDNTDKKIKLFTGDVVKCIGYLVDTPVVSFNGSQYEITNKNKDCFVELNDLSEVD